MDIFNPSTSLYSLPNEVFVQILTPLSTHTLLALTTVSHRFHALILRILHYRLRGAAPLKDYQIMLECFHPGSRLTSPAFCKYLGTDDLNGTDGLSGRHEGKGSLYEDVETAHQLGKLGSVYSRFRPETCVEERARGARLVVSSSDKAMTMSRDLVIAQFDDFSQLSIAVNLVKVMPRSHLLLSAVTVEQGVIRLFKNWLKERNAAGQCVSSDGRATEASNSTSTPSDRQMLWVDGEKNVGLTMRIKEKKYTGNTPVPTTEGTVCYEVEVDEIYIRTTRLLMTLEKSLQEQRKKCARAVIFTRA
ncbi:hypothetical protein ASPWEDRAFT_655724 [Aspergillus wentii DTO 134E9]|uniref:F-box domain-containing protein n=1 Tax=Aspergillus wentii DTO 134E9 TaxID=1073089 RepID=A0A1L9RBG8_ASPWE|nr:uncharacterized protein ASPWEDRAFT_655724 [Aspergillus wentii DTO 134E9]KAI9934797.1 hypothetical protein MW887_000414 [Aspergillus wentii]OJJ32228.1 hypothetical protein ASPWEDRAFT_655724 [Aspergillus wentii DTO 134E9]